MHPFLAFSEISLLVSLKFLLSILDFSRLLDSLLRTPRADSVPTSHDGRSSAPEASKVGFVHPHEGVERAREPGDLPAPLKSTADSKSEKKTALSTPECPLCSAEVFAGRLLYACGSSREAHILHTEIEALAHAELDVGPPEHLAARAPFATNEGVQAGGGEWNKQVM